MKRIAIGELVSKIDRWDPRKSCEHSFFSYIDIGSVGRMSKRIDEVVKTLAHEAPSRAQQLVQTADVLVSTVRPNLNAVAYVTAAHDGATASTGFTVLRPEPRKLDGRYLYNWTRTRDFVREMTNRSTGASYPAVSDAIVKEARIPLPPLAEQKRIAAILDKADEVRRKRQRAIELADEFLKSTFLEMFGDPVTNPKGWEVGKLQDLIHSATDGPHVSPDYTEDGVPFLSTRHVRPGGVVWNDLRHITAEEAKRQWRKCKPERGDVLYTKGGTTGIAAVVDFDVDIAVWVHVALLKTNHDVADPSWLAAMLNTRYCYAQSQRFTHGATNKDLGLTRMVKIKMYLPPLAAQRKFASIVARSSYLRGRVCESDTGTDDLFNSLVQRSFRGDLSAAEAGV